MHLWDEDLGKNCTFATSKRLSSRICMKRTIAFLIALLCFDIANAQVKHYTVKDGLQTNEVRQVIELPNGQVLVNCEGAFDMFDGHSFHEVPCDRSRSYRLSHYKGYFHLWQGDSLLWLRDFYRLYLFDARTLSFRYDIEKRLSANKELQQMSEEDCAYESPDSRWQQMADSIGAGSRLAHVLTDRQGGLWFGTQTNGLFYIRPPRPMAQFIAADNTLQRMVCGMTDRIGRTWLCTAEGLECYYHGQVTHYTQKNVSGFLHNRMIFITELQDGRLLLCNLAHYLGYFYPEKHEFQPLNKVLPELENYRMLIGACPLNRNKVAVYSQNGAFVLNTQKNSIEPFKPAEKIAQFSDKYNCMLMESSKHQLWIGTQNGLFIANGENVKHLSTAEGLANTCIRSLVEDGKGNTWVGTAAGISRVSSDFYITNYSLFDSHPSVSLNERAACRLSNGRLVFACNDGLALFHPEWFNNEDKSMPVILTAIEVNGEPTSQYLSLKTFRLTYNQDDIAFHFSALNYASPEQTQYRYRLKGIDRNWTQELGDDGQVTARYNSLPPGNYTFEAQASIGGGDWGEPLTLSFTILPPWWLTWWAKMGYGLIALVVLATLIVQYLKREKAKVERENEAKVNRLFELREEARHQFAENVNIDPGKISINKEEEELVSKLMKAIEKNMDNTDYTVDQLASDIALSRSNLYRRTQSMLGITPNDFLRNVRLKHAAHLLSNTDMPINQIALSVGFKSTRYFSQYFNKMFGVTPSEYREPK